MIKLNFEKPKKINMTLETQGLDNKKIEYYFIIEIENIKYGFPVYSNGLRLSIEIPKLSEIIKKDIKNGEYKAFVEAKIPTEDFKGYYVRPWEDTILIESIPKIDLKMENQTDQEEIKVTVSNPTNDEKETKTKKIDEYIEETKTKKIDEYIEETKKSKIKKILGEE